MGFFSWDCVECGHPMLSTMACNSINSWMNDVVVQTEHGTQIVGNYDGYGRVGDIEVIDLEECENERMCCRHRACWEKAGKPGYSKASKQSDDQGWLFDGSKHDMRNPLESEPTAPLEIRGSEVDVNGEGFVIYWSEGTEAGEVFVGHDMSCDFGGKDKEFVRRLFNVLIEKAFPESKAE